MTLEAELAPEEEELEEDTGDNKSVLKKQHMSSKGTPDTPAKRRRMVAYDPAKKSNTTN